ncbi:MAG: flavodoxin family protein [Clostridia bacterium]
MLGNKNILVSYYTRTNNTEKVANKLSKKLKADIDQIFDINDYSGIIGFIKAGYSAYTKRTTNINTNQDPSDYDLVIICSPVWSGTIPPAIRTYCQEFDIPQSAWLLTCGNPNTTVKNLPLTTNSVRTIYKMDALKIKDDNFEDELKEFLAMM